MKHKEKRIEDRYFFYGNSPQKKSGNIGEELLTLIKGHRVVCADILLSDGDNQDKNLHLELKMGYTKHQFRHVLNILKHCWYDGYGCYFKVTIWCSNGVWIERIGYGYEEWWSKRHYPPIPPNLS